MLNRKTRPSLDGCTRCGWYAIFRFAGVKGTSSKRHLLVVRLAYYRVTSFLGPQAYGGVGIAPKHQQAPSEDRRPISDDLDVHDRAHADVDALANRCRSAGPAGAGVHPNGTKVVADPSIDVTERRQRTKRKKTGMIWIWA